MIPFPTAAFNGSSFSYDTDAQAFITAAAISNNTQKSAIDRLVRDLKGQTNVSYATSNVWAKLDVIMPLVGGNATSHAVNLKSPGTFNSTFIGSPTHSSTGISWNGTSQYADTGYSPATSGVLNDYCIAYYSRLSGAYNSVETGCGDPYGYEMALNYSGTCYSYAYDNNTGTVSFTQSSNADQLWMQNRASASVHDVYRQGVLKFHGTTTNASTRPVATVKYGATSGSGGGTIYSQRACSFFFLGKSLTGTDALNVANSIQAYQTTLGRQI